MRPFSFGTNLDSSCPMWAPLHLEGDDNQIQIETPVTSEKNMDNCGHVFHQAAEVLDRKGAVIFLVCLCLFGCGFVVCLFCALPLC